MKRILFALSVAALAAGTACNPSTETTALPAPQNLHIAGVTNNGAGIILAWDAVEGAHGYNIYYNGSQIGNTVETTYTVDSLIGEFSVAAVDQDGNAGERAEVVSNYAVTGSGTVYERSQEGWSGFYWDPDGTGHAISLNEPTSLDFYLDDFTSGATNDYRLHFVSPTYNYFGGAFGSDTTWMSSDPHTAVADWFPSGEDVGEVAPYDDPSSPSRGLAPGDVYFMEVDVNGEIHYAWVKVTEIAANGEEGRVDFEYAFQPLANFRGLKTR